MKFKVGDFISFDKVPSLDNIYEIIKLSSIGYRADIKCVWSKNASPLSSFADIYLTRDDYLLSTSDLIELLKIYPSILNIISTNINQIIESSEEEIP